MADLTFYSSIRRGAALAITRQDTPNPSDPVAIPRVTLPVTLSYASEPAASTNLSLLGPGDIVGFDTRSIVRMFPPPNDNDAEAGFLCYVELDQADLPWRYTPAANAGSIAARTDQIRPWLTLVVLAEGTEFASGDFRPAQGNEKLPQLTVGSLRLLPDLSQVWAWAHVQGQQTLDDAGIAAAVAGPPGALVARLLSPRQLAPSTAYTAFLVPTFSGGVRAGQGNAASGVDGLAPAWSAATPFPFTLPVYHSWRFQTGTVSSFRQAVSELRPASTLPTTVGVRAMDVSSPGLSLTSPTGGTDPLFVGGALQTPEQAGVADPQLSTSWLNGIGALVDLGTTQTPPVVAPPIYGRWYAAEDHLDYPARGNPTNPPWFSLLNQDPRFRVAAGLGTEVVQRDQQALMAAAQEQASVLVNTVNRRRRIMQTGREVFTRMVGRHLNTPNGVIESILLVTAFWHGKVLSCTGGATPTPTIGGILSGSPFSGVPIPWRRPFRGPPIILIHTINTGGFIPQPDTPTGMSTPPTTVGPAIPGALPDPGIATIINIMNPDQRLYWGVVIFWVARQLLSTQGGKYWWLLRRLLRLGLDLIQLGSTQGVSSVTVLQKLRAGTLLGTDIQTIPVANNFLSITQDPVLSDPTSWPTPRAPTTTPGDSPQATAFKQAAIDLFNFVNGLPLAGRTIPAAHVPDLVTCILNSTAPAVTFTAYEKAIHVRTPGTTLAWQSSDPLEPILLPPAVSFPMWHRLAAISADWILPNVGDVPRNSVSLLETNQKFIESFMVGLNHQMNRELLWNGYPTDQRGTIFQQFWDPSGWADGDGSGPRQDTAFLDITPVKTWTRTSVLGSHTGRSPNVEHLVLLVRGDVIKRYPNVVVYAAKAVDPGGGRRCRSTTPSGSTPCSRRY